jgi:hypothetical protein
MEQDHKSLLIGLIGSTFGDLKKLDDSIVSRSSTLTRRSDDVKQELVKVMGTNFRPQPVAVPTNPVIQPVVPSQPQVVIPPPQAVTPPQFIPSTPVPIVQEEIRVNDPQLEFDFDKKARYIEVVDALKVVEVKIDSLDKKLDKILEILNSQEPKIARQRKKATQPIQVEEKKKVPGI